MTTPPARHLVDVLGQDLLFLHAEGTADAVVMKGPGLPGNRHVEAGEISAGTTPVARRCHEVTLPVGDAPASIMATILRQ
jgi:hypothetical protein